MSPRTPKQLESLKESRKEQILVAALRLFSKKGFYHTSISDITKKANLSKGLLYNYFESKEDLLNQVVVFAFKDVTAAGEEMYVLFNELPPEKIFKELIFSYFLMLKEEKELMKLTLSLAVQVSAIPSVHDTIASIYSALLGQLEVVFEKMGYKNPKMEAMLLGAIVDGVGIQYMLDVDNYPLDDLKEMIINKYIHNDYK